MTANTKTNHYMPKANVTIVITNFVDKSLQQSVNILTEPLTAETDVWHVTNDGKKPDINEIYIQRRDRDAEQDLYHEFSSIFNLMLNTIE